MGLKSSMTCIVISTTGRIIHGLSSPTLPTPEPQLGVGEGLSARGLAGGLGLPRPAHCDTSLIQAPLCLPWPIRAQRAGWDHLDPSATLIAQPHIP